MGMAASQARLLSLTSRLSDLEYNSQLISNEKMALARQSSEASDNYIAALDKQIIKVVDDDDNSKVTATAANLTTYNAISTLSKQRMLKTTSGELIVSKDVADAYNISKSASMGVTLHDYLLNLAIDGKLTLVTNSETAEPTTDPTTDIDLDALGEKITEGVDKVETAVEKGVDVVKSGITGFFSGITSSINSERQEEAKQAAKYTLAASAADATNTNVILTNEEECAVDYLSSLTSGDDPKTTKYAYIQMNAMLDYVDENLDDYLNGYDHYHTKPGYQPEEDYLYHKYVQNYEDDTRNNILNGKITLTEEDEAAISYLNNLRKQAALSGKDIDAKDAYLKLTAFKEAYGKTGTATSSTSSTIVLSEPETLAQNVPTQTTVVDPSTIVLSEPETLEQNVPIDRDDWNNYDQTQIASYTASYYEKASSIKEETFLNQFGYSGDSTNSAYDKGATSWYGEIFEQMNECGYEVVADDKLNDNDWLYQQLSTGNIYLSEKVAKSGNNGEDAWNEVSWTSGDNEITTVDDTTGYAKAEAEYEAATAKISAKDERFDMQLKNIDTEHSAVQTEIETVGKVINKNIERSFKMFDA